jgi:hypothetical protein
MPVIVGVLLGAAASGCATNGTSDPREKASGGYLSSASAVHSEFDMRMSLLLTANGRDCVDNDCDSTYHFEQRVQAIGERLSQATFAKYPELSKRFEKFEFVVADKYDSGAKSSGAGTIVILRGVERLGFDDESLAFIMAREMAHVVAGHYESNMLTSIAISIVVQLVMPVFNVARGAAAVASTSPAASTLVGSAASMAGNQALRANLRPGQLREAEEMGMELLVLSGYDAKAVVESLQTRVTQFPLEEDWVLELRGSVARVAKMTSGPSPEIVAKISTPVIVPVIAKIVEPIPVQNAPSVAEALATRQIIAAMGDTTVFSVIPSYTVPARNVSGSKISGFPDKSVTEKLTPESKPSQSPPQSALPLHMIKGMPVLY